MHHEATQLLNADWISRLNRFDKLVVGFSGGLDSTVLLHHLASHASLHAKLLAVHINHGISPNASVWQQHCQQFCQHLGVNFIAETVQFDRLANVEEGARIARYAVFASLLAEKDCLLLGHHQDDQAETVLLHLLRGAGVDGLAAMTEWGHLTKGTLGRPFLNYTRSQLSHYAALHQLAWVEDESNEDVGYTRNYLRQRVLPLLVTKWPGAVGNIARTATHCQQAKNNLAALALQDHPELGFAQDALLISPLLNLAFERIANVLRVWLKKRQIKAPSTVVLHRIIHELIFARPDAMPQVSWGLYELRRYQHHLYLTQKDRVILPAAMEWGQFPSPLMLGETGRCIVASPANAGVLVPARAKIEIRFRQGGETFYLYGQTKQLKKLFQDWQVPPWLRHQVPLLYINNELAAVINYAISDAFFHKNTSSAWLFAVQ